MIVSQLSRAVVGDSHVTQVVTKRPGIDREWHHTTLGISPHDTTITTPTTEQSNPITTDVDQTIFYEEKVAPMLDEIKRALAVGQ